MVLYITQYFQTLRTDNLHYSKPKWLLTVSWGHSSLTHLWPLQSFFIWESPSLPTQVFKVSEVILFPLQALHQPHTNSTFSLSPQSAYFPPFPWQPLWCQPLELPHLHHCKPVSLPPPLEASLYPAAGTWNKIQFLSLYDVKSSHGFFPLRTSRLLHHPP